MAVRIRATGEIVCAAMHPPVAGDTYLNDGIAYRLSAELHVLVTDKDHLDRPGHKGHGLWWWANQVPDGVQVDAWWAPYEDNQAHVDRVQRAGCHHPPLSLFIDLTVQHWCGRCRADAAREATTEGGRA